MARRIDTQAEIDWVRLTDQAGDPASPAAGYKYFYAKSGGIYLINSAGTVLGPIKTVATDEIWDAAGDLVQGTGANAAAKLSLGTANQLLRVNSGATAVEWVSAGKVLISEQTPTGTGTVTWDSIPATYKSLEIEFEARGTESATSTDLALRFNNDSTAGNYRRMILGANLDTTSIISGSDTNVFTQITAATGLANNAGYAKIKIINYALTTFHKVAIGETAFRSATGSLNLYNFGLNWESANAISRVDLVLASGNYDTGSVFRLYGVF